MKRVLPSAAVLGVTTLLLTACASDDATARSAPGEPTGLSAHGVATVTGVPDTATIVLGVQTQAPSASSALSDNNQRSATLIDALTSRGVAAPDVQTSQLSITPSYDPTGERISGYQVTNLVTVTLHNVAGAGGVIDAASQAAGDDVRVQQLSFSIADDGPLRARARAAAVARARTQAEQLAKAAGVTLGGLRSITEAPQGPPPPSPLYREGLGGAPAAATPVEPGSQLLTVSVNLVYDIDQ